MKTKKIQSISKKGKILSDICKECGRYNYIPRMECNRCWKEMETTITSIKPNENN